MKKKFNKWGLSNPILAGLLFAVAMVFLTTPIVQGVNAAPNIVRHQGERRENVAENVAKNHFSDSNKVIIVNRNKFPDAISATNISQGRYPVLYTNAGYVTDETIQLIQSMSLDEIYVLGGEVSINPSVVTQLRNTTGVKVTRVDGRDRYVANSNAVKKHFSQKNHVVIASGEVYADALYGVSYANTIDAPIVLTKTNRLEPATVDLLNELNVNRVTIIGGPATVTKAVENQLSHLGITHKRIAGQNRYIGSAEVASASYTNPQNMVIASGEVFPDALVSAPLAQKLDAPILLVRSNRMENVVENYIVDNSAMASNIFVQGGPRTIRPSLLDSIFMQVPREPMDILDISFDMTLFNQEVLALVNEERAHLGIETLYYEPALQYGVDTRTLDSISIQTLRADHSRPDDSDWSTAFNYLEDTPVFTVGENLAYNWLTYDEYEKLAQTRGALEARLAVMFYGQYANSPGHYDNMINAGFDGIAVSTMFADHGDVPGYIRVYNTMVFSINY